jgi:hypothetical protein
VIVPQRLDANATEADILHPGRTVRPGKVRTARYHEQDVEARKKAVAIGVPFIVDQEVGPIIKESGIKAAYD